MTDNTYNLDRFALPLPITQRARQIADQFARQQPTAEKGVQVRLNTLAVCVVNDYLQLMNIQTDLNDSDSWNPVTRLCADVADLAVIGAGRLECRPLLLDRPLSEPMNLTCSIPAEVWDDRIGYIVVQFDESLQAANLLGFVETVATEDLPVRALQPPEALLDRLDQLLHPIAQATPVQNPLTQLNRWFQDAIEAGWQTVDSLLSPASPAFAFRSAPNTIETPSNRVRRAKLFDFGMQFDDRPVVLVVELTPDANDRTSILLQLYPAGTQTYLPPNLQLLVLDDSGAPFLEAQSRQADNYIQLQFSGQTGEHFSLQIALGTASITEAFVI